MPLEVYRHSRDLSLQVSLVTNHHRIDDGGRLLYGPLFVQSSAKAGTTKYSIDGLSLNEPVVLHRWIDDR